MDSGNMKIFVRSIVAIFILALIIIKIMTECLLRRRRSRNDVPKDRLSIIRSTSFVEKQIVSTILQSRNASQTREDYLTSNEVQAKHYGISSIRFYNVVNCQPLAANPSCTEQSSYQSEVRPAKIIDERANVEKIIECPGSKMEASKNVSYAVDKFTQTSEIHFNEYSITAEDENRITFTYNVKKTGSGSCTRNFQTETQDTHTFHFESRFTQTAPIEIQYTQVMQEEKQTEKHAPIVTTINTQTPYPVLYQSDSRNYKQEREYEHRINYRSRLSQEDLHMARYPVDIMPYIFPTSEDYSYYFDPNLYFLSSLISEKPVMKQKLNVKKTKEAETNDKNEEKRVTETKEKYIIIQQPPPVHTIVREGQTQTVPTSATSSPSIDMHKLNKYREYLGQLFINQFSRYPMNKQSQMTAISGPRSSLNLGKNNSTYSGQKQERTLISEDLNRIWKKIHQSRQHGSKKLIKLELEFLKQDQYNSQCQEKNILLADYDTNYSKLSSADNEIGVLQRYFEDVSNNAEQTNVKNESLLNQTSLKQMPSRSTHVSGFSFDMGSSMPNAATIRQRINRLHSKL